MSGLEGGSSRREQPRDVLYHDLNEETGEFEFFRPDGSKYEASSEERAQLEEEMVSRRGGNPPTAGMPDFEFGRPDIASVPTSPEDAVSSDTDSGRDTESSKPRWEAVLEGEPEDRKNFLYGTEKATGTRIRIPLVFPDGPSSSPPAPTEPPATADPTPEPTPINLEASRTNLLHALRIATPDLTPEAVKNYTDRISGLPANVDVIDQIRSELGDVTLTQAERLRLESEHRSRKRQRPDVPRSEVPRRKSWFRRMGEGLGVVRREGEIPEVEEPAESEEETVPIETVQPRRRKVEVATSVPFRGEVPGFIKRSESKSREEPKPLTREEPPSISAIQASPDMRNKFLLLLSENEKFASDNLHAKYTRALEGAYTLTNNDDKQLAEARSELARRSSLAEEVRGVMKDEEMIFLLQEEPNFAFLKNSLDPERAGQIIKEHIPTFFMTANEAELEKMVYSHRANLDVRASKKYQRMQTRVEEKLGKENVLPENVVDEAEKAKMVKDGFLARGSSNETLQAVNANLRAIGQLLAATVSKDTELRRLVTREATSGQRIQNPEETGPASFQDTLRQRDQKESRMTDEMLVNSVSEYKQVYEQYYGTNWEETSLDERSHNFVDYMLKREGIEMPRMRESWFGAMLEAMLTMFLVRKIRGNEQLKAALAE